MIKVVEILGSNGSGKTSLVKDLGAISQDWTYLQDDDGLVYATVFEDIRWVAIGKYDQAKRMGGCDLMPSVAAIKQAITKVRRLYPTHWIVFEGMMISTIRSTFYEFLTGMESKTVEVVFVVLRTELQGCLDRIHARGSTKPGLNVRNIEAKCAQVLRNAASYDPAYVRWIDVEKTPKDAMLGCFLWEVYDHELMDALYDQVYA